MNTFWGCETENLTELSTVVGARSERLRTLIQRAAISVRATAWFGPDAEDHRQRTEDLVEFVIELVERLRELGELLDQEAEEQDVCSQPDGGPTQGGDPLGVRATPPWFHDQIDHLPSLRGPRLEDLQPQIGGPFMAEDPVKFVENLPGLDDLGPLIRIPVLAEDPPWAVHPSQPLPDGEDFALDPEILAEAEHQRKLMLGGLPGVGLAQTLMSGHEAIGDLYDRAEMTLEENGYGAFTPLVSLARIPHDLSGAVLGEKSVLGQVTSAVDRGVANVAQTSGEILSEVGDGDGAGAFRALERGMFRQVGASADILTATSVPAVADTASDLIGTGADLVEPFNPESAEILRTAEQDVRGSGLAWEQGQEQLTDPELYYDLRRTYLPMPWDPQA